MSGIDSFEWFWMGSLSKNIQPFKRQSHKRVKHTQTIRWQFADELLECVWPFCDIGTYRVNAGVSQGSVFGSTFLPLYINDLPDDVVWNIAIYADDTTLYCKCDQASDLWQLEMAAEFESDIRNIMDWGSKWLHDFNAGKTHLNFLTGLTTLVILMCMHGSVLEEKSSFNMLGCFSILNWIGAQKLSLLLRFVLWSFFLLKFLCISRNIPYDHAWNNVVMSGMLLLAAI